MMLAFDEKHWQPGVWVGSEGASVELFDSMWVIVHVDAKERVVRLEPEE